MILGLWGMDKFVYDDKGIIIFNDGVIIMKFLDIVYLVVKIFVDIVKL